MEQRHSKWSAERRRLQRFRLCVWAVTGCVHTDNEPAGCVHSIESRPARCRDWLCSFTTRNIQLSYIMSRWSKA